MYTVAVFVFLMTFFYYSKKCNVYCNGISFSQHCTSIDELVTHTNKIKTFSSIIKNSRPAFHLPHSIDINGIKMKASSQNLSK